MMLSRVADHQYWMARQMERAENLARLVRVSEEMLLDDESLGRGTAQEYWTPVLAATAMQAAFHTLYPEPKLGDVARFLTLDLRNPDSILSCIRLARENARSVRDKISDEMWSEINALNLFVTSPEGLQLLERFPQAYYEKIIASSMLFDGITDATLTRDEGWNFLQLGRLLERADMTSRFLDIRSQTQTADGDSALESLQWGRSSAPAVPTLATDASMGARSASKVSSTSSSSLTSSPARSVTVSAAPMKYCMTSRAPRPAAIPTAVKRSPAPCWRNSASPALLR